MFQPLLTAVERRCEKRQKNARSGIAIVSCVVGILTNALLFGGKLAVGLLSGSISITADAVNNLSDTASSVLTLLGFYIAGKPADKQHPYGHERFEYISGMVVSILIIFVGGQFFLSSVDRIRYPESISVTPVVLAVLIVSVVVKIFQSLLYRDAGKKIDSATLIATAKDSLNDVYTTGTVLVAAVVQNIWDIQIDGYVGLFISGYIVVSGIRLIIEFINELMGLRPSPEMIESIEKRLCEFDDIEGYHDLLIHRYGNSYIFASVHIETDENLSLLDAHRIIDKIEKDSQKHLGVELVCHLDPIPVRDKTHDTWKQSVEEILQTFLFDFKMHDFHITTDEKDHCTWHFDLVLPAKSGVTEADVRALLEKQIQQRWGDISVDIHFDGTYLL